MGIFEICIIDEVAPMEKPAQTVMENLELISPAFEGLGDRMCLQILHLLTIYGEMFARQIADDAKHRFPSSEPAASGETCIDLPSGKYKIFFH